MAIHESPGAPSVPLVTKQPTAIARIQAALGSLVASERRVAEIVLADPRAVIGSTAAQLAARADTSATTVIRFARSVGFAGYQQLAIALAITEPTLESATPLESADTPIETLRKIATIGSQSLRKTAESVDPAALSAAVSAIAEARHVLAIGAALSAPVALDVAYRLNHLGISADAPADSQIQRIRAARLGPADVCLVFLHGGTYQPVIDLLHDAAATGATIVGVTSFVRTPLAEHADHALVVGAGVVGAGVEAWASRLSFLAVADALVLSVINMNPGQHRASLARIQELVEGGGL